MPDLKRYRDKRDPERTPEPLGEERSAPALAPDAPRAFVVQQHAARNLHYDLRLEIDGALASWAVPRGPSLDSREKRLAARTEDHPLEYADFEGVIPAGNYGAGAMIVWDRGCYRSLDGHPPEEGLARGKLDLWLEGHKLRGRFALVRMKGEEGKSWLLLSKLPPDPARAEPVSAQPGSVLSGLTVAELRDGLDHTQAVAELAVRAGARRRPLGAAELSPMLAETAPAPFTREGWLFELKYDGARLLACKSTDGAVRLVARSGRDATATYPEIARALRQLPVSDCVLDGEVVALDASGRCSFERLQRRFRGRPTLRAELETPVLFYAFDLVAAAGQDLRGCPLSLRKQILSAFAPRLGVIRFADHVEGEGEALFEAARSHGFEGVVAKRADSRYESGRRSRSWLKIKVPRAACLAIVGFAPRRGSRHMLGSLLLAWRGQAGLVYAGSVGSGLDEATAESLRQALQLRVVPEPAFDGAPPELRRTRGALYVDPELACEVSFTEVTEAGLLRQPVFARLRPDRRPSDCDPRPSSGGSAEPDEEYAVTAAVAHPAERQPRLELTRLEKVFWPVEGYTKGDLLAYYERVWPWLAPYLRDRPLVLTRYPDGIDGKSFYQKNAPEFTPAWALRENVDGTDYFICNELRTLLYVINSGAIPLHVWSSRRTAIERPDWLVLDLDPKEAPFAHVVEIARFIHRLLESLGAAHFLKTSGQDGLHVLVPLAGALDHDDAKRLGEVLARVVCAELPEIATIARPLAARADRVYVDFLQNGRGKLIAAPLSVRPRPGAPVSMPLRWSQLGARLDPARFTIRTAVRALEARGDPFAGVLGPGVDVAALLAALSQRLAS